MFNTLLFLSNTDNPDFISKEFAPTTIKSITFIDNVVSSVKLAHSGQNIIMPDRVTNDVVVR